MFDGHLHAFNQVSSTNDVAKRLAKEGAPEGTLIVAEQQLRGRGRANRQWVSPPSVGLWFSLVLRPESHAENVGLVSLLGSVAVAEVLGLSTAQVGLKWPNDVLVQGRKVCGVLGETDFHGSRLTHVVLGIGINVNQTVKMFPPELVNRVTSLRMATGSQVDREDLLVKLLMQVEDLYLAFTQARFNRIIDAWRRHCHPLHQCFYICDGERSHKGQIESVDEFGRLVLRLSDGSLITTHSTDLKPCS